MQRTNIIQLNPNKTQKKILKECMLLRKWILPLLITFLIPATLAINYNEGTYGGGLYGYAEEEVVEEAKGEAISLAGGGCDFYSDRDMKCYYTDLQTGGCIEGCLEEYYCNDTYRCEKTTEIPTTYLLEKTKLDITTLILILSFVLLMIICVTVELEKTIQKRKKESKRTEEIIEEAENA